MDLSKQGFQMSLCMEQNFNIYAWSGHLQEASYIFIVWAHDSHHSTSSIVKKEKEKEKHIMVSKHLVCHVINI
jgi:hypothetical protein